MTFAIGLSDAITIMLEELQAGRAASYGYDLMPRHAVKSLAPDIALAKRGIRCHGVASRASHGRRMFIVGDSITVADCVTAYLMDWANERRLIDDCPHLRGYLSGCIHALRRRRALPMRSPRPG